MVKLIKGESDLATLHPDLVKEWHPIKNGDLMPEDISSGSGKEVWWLCPEGHTYSMVVNQRTKRGYGCPYCSGHRAIRGINDLATANPELSEEWNYEKNNNLTPYDVTAGSHKKVWWLCGKGHPYEQFIIKRANRGYSCPYCSGHKVLRGFNDLATLNPRLAKEWLWGDRIFEKCGIGRDEGGDGGKTLEIRGKRRLSARDGGANYQQS